MSTIAELKIALDDKGRVAITGPIEQTMLCYGLLEIAKDMIRRQNEEKRVSPAGMSDLAALGRQS